MIIDSVPDHERSKFGAPIVEGFNNLNYPLTKIEEALDNSFLKGKYLTAVGKTEWWDVKWNDQSIAEKKNVIERADFVFIAADSEQHCVKAHDALHDAGVNDRLLDCSDAHTYSTETVKDRIGHCFCWIKADSTFEGLRQVRHAPDERIFLGAQPPKLKLVESHPTKFIKSLSIRRKPDATLGERWFDDEVDFNADLVAIIGNKGMGKSALTDIIALTANTDIDPSAFGFLRENRFRDRKNNKARHFVATITWESGDTHSRGLEESVPKGTVPQVRYIPQHYFEDLCNETGDAGLLQQELRKVIFGNLPAAQRGKFASLEDLINDRTSEANRRIDELRGELSTINRDIVKAERDLSKNRTKEIEDALVQQEAALQAHLSNEPVPVQAPPDQPESPPALVTARVQLQTIEQRLLVEKERLTKAYERQALVENLLVRFQTLAESIGRVNAATQEDLARIGLRFEQLVPAAVNVEPLRLRQTQVREEIAQIDVLLDGTGGLVSQETTVRDTLASLQDALDEPNREYQRYLDARETWTRQRDTITGSKEAAGSIENLKWRLTTGRAALEKSRDDLRAERRRVAREIHEQQLAITNFLKTLYSGVDERLRQHVAVTNQLNVNFTAHLADTGLAVQFTAMINRGRVGPFSDENAMRDRVASCDVNNTEELVALLQATIDQLLGETDGGDIDELQRQLKTRQEPETLYTFLYGLTYLDPRYALRVNDRDVSQLTPGERGSLLLVFYLLIDQDDRPLVIDQPEENLDNQSVYQLLVPCIAEAKRRRQIIIVTHNPNLAVVCNAEQIIWCKIEKETDYEMRYVRGGLENSVINKHVVDVLEGTWPAFEDRGEKYEPIH
jgi:predicted ATPase